MTSQDLSAVAEAFERAVEQPGAEERAAILAALAPDLRREVERLLAADARGSLGPDLLAELVAGEAAHLIEESPDPWLGRTIGPWRIERRLGSGGMSVVYLAERADRELPMRVALKLVKRGMDTDEVVRRFRTERRILANLAHPHIARLLDGGATPEGAPYFVLELVVGEPIDAYADRHRLSLAARIDLVRQVAGAVAAAHRSLIVHRDLKPSNILVTEEGVPKLLDFGIAKLLGPEGGADEEGGREERTATQLRVMTPSYASPEQLAGLPATTATDVYALGVVLCELLAGRRPYRLRGGRGAERGSGTVDLERAIREEEPDLPSAALLREEPGEPSAREIAERRGLDPRVLARALRGDLDTIVATCLQKEPERRYATADRLAEDLGCYLESRPIAARRDSFVERAGKFLRRHRVAAVATGMGLLALIGFVAALAVQSVRLARERDASAREGRRAEAVASFLTDLFRVARPGGDGGTVTARELLDQGAQEIAGRPAEDPKVQATLLDTVGRVYLQLGLYDRALPPLEKALALRRRTLPKDDPEIAESLNRLAVLSAESGAYERAIALFREALDLRRRRFGSASGPVAVSLNNLALALQDRGSYAAAEPLYREALAIDSRLLPPGDPGLLSDRTNLALLLFDLGSYPEAERMLRAVIAGKRGLPEGDPERAELDRYLGAVLTARGRLAEAEALLGPAEARTRAALGPDHPETARTTAALAELQLARGQARQAIGLFTTALESRRKRLGRDHPEVVPTLDGLARALLAAGEPAAAEARFREAIALARRVLPSGHPDLASAMVGLGSLLVARDEPGGRAEACTLAREARAIRAAAYPPGDPRIAEADRLAAACR
ncbi:MAG TPA: serine/threonine-protein kinase [Thermoanaerobaculia bacterium]|nr:serine/threonine-protein kinase [Thermoanaerobaculia bacterium]